MCKVQILSSLSLSHPDVVRICVGGRSLLQAALHTSECKIFSRGYSSMEQEKGEGDRVLSFQIIMPRIMTIDQLEFYLS